MMRHWQAYLIKLPLYDSLIIIDEREVGFCVKGLWSHKLVVYEIPQHSLCAKFPREEKMALRGTPLLIKLVQAIISKLCLIPQRCSMQENTKLKGGRKVQQFLCMI